MQLSEIAKLSVRQNSESCDTMIANDLISRLQRKETDIQYKKAKKCNKKK